MAESNKVIYAAIVANTAIGATKFTAAALTGSSAMISEGIHPGFRSRAWLSSTRHDPEVVKTLKGVAAKSSHAMAVLRDGCQSAERQ